MPANDRVTYPVVDVAQLLDVGAWSAWQKAVAFFAALTIIFDGMDIQMMGFAIPAIAKDWGVARASFAPVLAVGLVGVALGAAMGGLIGDRAGRRFALLCNVGVFGVATLSIAFVHSLTALLILRLIAGLGIGGALPNAATLTAEFTPRDRRPAAVNLAVVCIPLGGVIAGLIAAQVLTSSSWRVLFVIGGLSPLALTLLLAFVLPESPHFLAQREERWKELRITLRKIGREVPADTSFLSAKNRVEAETTTASEIFGRAQARNTFSLWVAFLMCLLTVYLVFNWLPSLLVGSGLNIKTASEGLASYNFGGIFGAVLFGWWITYKGSRGPLLLGSVAGILSALLLLVLSRDHALGHALLLTALTIHGFFVNAVQTSLYALAAYIYPAHVRATGVSCAMGVGRLGAVLSAFIGSYVLHLQPASYFGMLALSMSGVFVALAVLKKHIEPARDVLGLSATGE